MGGGFSFADTKAPYVQAYDKGDKVDVIYLEWWQQLFLPEAVLDKLQFDWQVLYKSLIVMVLAMMALVWRALEFRNFRNNSRFY